MMGILDRPVHIAPSGLGRILNDSDRNLDPVLFRRKAHSPFWFLPDSELQNTVPVVAIVALVRMGIAVQLILGQRLWLL